MEEMSQMKKIKHKYSSSYSWWFQSHNNDSTQQRSPWLHDTLAELEETTMTMLNIIEEDGDTFAKRAEIYYKKRPELIGVIKDMYISHRSLAEEIDKLKSESVSSHKSYDSYSLESTESVLVYDDDLDDEEEEDLDAEISMKEIEEEEDDKKRMMNEKDEEKREVIRQLTMALDSVMEENMMMKRKLAAVSINRSSLGGRRRPVLSELKRIKDIVLGKFIFFNNLHL
ncbi:protein NETWORKED 3A-like [Impatiens glandulifera]|uniref:protein NETWORKED 3A-like n=1 Tax=Impatiens glandulifera TaxID=253017 RepID=UPI001FB0DE3D|nr:protein NETWORKED 3A-like [Impatiens glandulifera]